MKRLAAGVDLVVATHNRGKAREFATLLAPHGIRARGAAELGLAAPDESGETFEANAALKARAAATASGLVALADDSGLCVEALDGAPGVRSADWEGPARDPTVAMRRLADALDAALAAQPGRGRAARFVCVLALAWPDGHVETVRGECAGEIVWPPRGQGGHGYDPIFRPDGSDRTFAEMDGSAKEAIGHRGRAFRLLAEGCLP